MKKETEEDIKRYKSMIGCKVWKKRGKATPKPFKSGQQINTVKRAEVIHPVTGLLCFEFEEDDSYVECFRCKVFKGS
jgi:hypothetical protein